MMKSDPMYFEIRLLMYQFFFFLSFRSVQLECRQPDLKRFRGACCSLDESLERETISYIIMFAGLHSPLFRDLVTQARPIWPVSFIPVVQL